MNLYLYVRRNCHLCDEVKANLISLQKKFPFTIHVIDVDHLPPSQKRYDHEVPVVEIGAIVLKAPITYQELEIAVSEAFKNFDQESQPTVDKDSQVIADRKISRMDRCSYWISKHYLGLINAFLILFVGLPFLAPVLMKNGFVAPATIIYKVYRTTCHQLAFRSFFLFGEQGYYPKASAHIDDVITYDEATHLGEDNNPENLLDAREFVGTEQLGYKIALCQRDVAIYIGILIFNYLFILARRKIPALPWYLWIVIGLLPIGLDGLSQLFSQPPLSFIPFRESTPLLRVLTGFLFGFTTAWFGIPNVEVAMKDSIEIMEYRNSQSLAQK
jgi:uncharacterized membrane protein